MEEKKPKHRPTPGIPEAIHPDIGNGVAWEQDKHAFLLRNPDITKQLDLRLLSEETFNHGQVQNQPNEADSLLPESSQVRPVTSESTGNSSDDIDKSVSDTNDIGQADNSSLEIDPAEITKPARKKKPAKAQKTEQDSSPRRQGPKREKTQKAGKLVKKAAKTVKRQEAARNLVEPTEQIMREINLSPYTKWLKNLAGSEYVHPYDEDYAFNQGGVPPSGGISETYATLLAAQGHKDQAIEMYLRLMEKYPEKSSFFAAKIEALQQQ